MTNLIIDVRINEYTLAQLISRIVRMAREMGRQIATPEETRQALGLV